MGLLNRKKYISFSHLCESDASFGVSTGLFPNTDFKLFPISGKNNHTIGIQNNTISLVAQNVISGFRYYSPDGLLEPLEYTPNASRVFNQKVYPENYLTFTNDEDHVGRSNTSVSLDVSGYDYNDGEDWTTATKVYVLKITKSGVNGTGEFVLQSFPYIENNNDYVEVADAQSLYSESLPLYKTTSGVSFHNSNIGSLCDFRDMDILWAESRRKDPAVKDDFVCVTLEDANTLKVYDYYLPFLPAIDNTVTLSDDAEEITYADGNIYTYSVANGIHKVNPSTSSEVFIASKSDIGGVWSNIRYIRATNNGHLYNDVVEFPECNWVELQAYTPEGVNVALNKVVTGTCPAVTGFEYSKAVNGDFNQDNGYAKTSLNGPQSITVDLGDTFELNGFRFSHLYSVKRVYHDVKLEVSTDNLTWDTVFDSSVEGEYTEVYGGRFWGLENSTDIIVSHPDQDYVYVIGRKAQICIDVSDDSYTTFSNNFGDLADLMPVFDEDGNVWFGKYKFSKAMSLLYTHSEECFCNYNYIIDANEEYFDLAGNSLDGLALSTYSDIASCIKRYPQSYILPYNTIDLTNNELWYDSTGSEYDGSTNAYQIPSNGEINIIDGIHLSFDDNGGFNQVVEDDYFYFVVSGKGMVIDNWTDAQLKICLAAYDFTEYTKSITLADATYTISETGLSNFIELNTLVISGNWNDSSEIIFTTSTPDEGEIQVNSNGTMTFNTNDIGRIATITYNVGYGV